MSAEQLSPGQQLTEASTQMKEAWEKMVKAGQYPVYQGLGQERIEQLKDGGKPKPGEEHIAQYLKALNRFFNSVEAIRS